MCACVYVLGGVDQWVAWRAVASVAFHRRDQESEVPSASLGPPKQHACGRPRAPGAGRPRSKKCPHWGLRAARAQNDLWLGRSRAPTTAAEISSATPVTPTTTTTRKVHIYFPTQRNRTLTPDTQRQIGCRHCHRDQPCRWCCFCSASSSSYSIRMPPLPTPSGRGQQVCVDVPASSQNPRYPHTHPRPPFVTISPDPQFAAPHVGPCQHFTSGTRTTITRAGSWGEAACGRASRTRRTPWPTASRTRSRTIRRRSGTSSPGYVLGSDVGLHAPGTTLFPTTTPHVPPNSRRKRPRWRTWSTEWRTGGVNTNRASEWP